VRARVLGAIAVLAAAATLLTSCRTNVGVAATVNGHRISETTVNKYVTQEGADPSLAAQAKAQGQPLPTPKPFVLQILVLDNLFEHTLAANGGVPSDGQLAAVHDKAAQAFLQTSAAGRQVEREEGTNLHRIGVSTSFAPILVRAIELNYVLVEERLKSVSLGAAINKAGAKVSVSPRYGAWDAKSLSLKYSDTDGVPGYLRLQPTPAGSAAVGLPAP
jgi:predicted small secreted protein